MVITDDPRLPLARFVKPLFLEPEPGAHGVKMGFPNPDRLITGIPQSAHPGVLVRPWLVIEITAPSRPKRRAPRRETGPGRNASGRWAVSIGKQATLPGQLIEKRSPGGAPRFGHTHGVPAPLIGHDYEDIRCRRLHWKNLTGTG